VRQKVEPGHQQHGIDGQQPMVLEHLPDLMEEDACLGLGGLLGIVLPLFSSTDEDTALGKESPQHGGKSGDSSSSPEQRTPGGMRNKVQVYDSGDEVSDSVSLLHNSASETASLDGEVFESGCRG